MNPPHPSHDAERLRAAERRWRETGGVDDHAALLRERLLAGDLSKARLELAAFCGHPAALRVTGPPGPGVPASLPGWVDALTEGWPEVVTSAAGLVVAPCLEVWTRAFPDDARPATALARLAEVRAAPGPERRRVALLAAEECGIAGSEVEERDDAAFAASAVYRFVLLALGSDEDDRVAPTAWPFLYAGRCLGDEAVLELLRERLAADALGL